LAESRKGLRHLYRGAGEEDVVDLSVADNVFAGKVEESVGGSASNVNHVLLACGTNAEAEELGAAFGHGEAEGEEVADENGEEELVVVAFEIAFSCTRSLVDKLTAEFHGVEDDLEAVGKELVDCASPLDVAKATLGEFEDVEGAEPGTNVLGVNLLDDASFEHSGGVVRLNIGGRDVAGVDRLGQVFFVDVGVAEVSFPGVAEGFEDFFRVVFQVDDRFVAHAFEVVKVDRELVERFLVGEERRGTGGTVDDVMFLGLVKEGGSEGVAATGGRGTLYARRLLRRGARLLRAAV